MKIVYGNRGPEIWLQGNLVGYHYEQAPQKSLEISAGNLETIRQVALELHKQPAHRLMAHQLYFWLMGAKLPEDYKPLGDALGVADGQVYFLGAQASRQAIRENWALALKNFPMDWWSSLRLWLLFPWRGLEQTTVRGLPGGVSWNGQLLLSQEGVLLYEKGDIDPSSNLLEWLKGQPLEAALELNIPAVAGWKVNPKAPPVASVLRHWYRAEKPWLLGLAFSKVWLLGPGVAICLKPARNKDLQEAREAGHLSPDDPTCVFWVQAASKKAPPVKPGDPSLVRDLGSFRLFSGAKARWVELNQQAYEKPVPYTRALEEGWLNPSEMSTWFLENNKQVFRTTYPMEYVGRLDGLDVFLGKTLAERWELRSTSHRIGAYSSRQDAHTAVVRHGLTSLWAMERLVAL
jgi:hypothetical protein